MKNRRNFVTYVIVLGFFALLAAIGPYFLESRLATQGIPNATELARLGNEKLQQSLTIEQELHAGFGVDLSGENSRELDLKELSLTQRRQMQAKLALYLSLINQVLEIDAQKNLTLENRASLLSARDRAEAVQKAIENFERVYGENYRPKNPRLI